MTALPSFTSGYRLIDGSQLNLIVDTVNNITGSGTPQPGTFSTLSASDVATFAVGAVGAPSLTFTGDTDTGIYHVGANSLALVANGAAVATFSTAGIGAANGTAAAPSFNFAADPDTGLYRSAANIIGVAVNGGSVGTFDANGFNGAVGGTTPAAGAFTTVAGTAFTGTYFTASAYFNNSVGNALTAAGTTRADALALTKQINNVTTAAAGTGVVLPAVTTAGVGAIVVVFNAGASPVQVYGAGSDTIDGVAGATGVPLTNALRCLYMAVAANTWVSAQLGVVSA